MNRKDIIAAVAEVLDTKQEAIRAVDTTFDAIRAGLHRDHKVLISSFGTFRVRNRQPRQGRNPRTGAPVSVPPRSGIRFKASRQLVCR
jgi:nucleoid DNA-binding protein